jgi:type I restriction enzyme S subunit
VLKLGAVSFGTFNEKQNKELPATLQPKPSLEVKSGDVLISRANVLRLVGASARVIETRPKLMLCDKIFRVVFHKESEIAPDFLAHILRTPFVREQIERAATGTSPTMKNISKPSLLNLQFPLPPLTVQSELVAQSSGQNSDATKMRQQAATIAAETMARVEEMILGIV